MGDHKKCLVAGASSSETSHRFYSKLAAIDAAGLASPEVELAEPLKVITTPLKLQFWKEQLEAHPDQGFAGLILKGIEQGFKIGFNGNPAKLRSKGSNMLSTLSQPQVVTDYIADELQLGRIAEVGSAERAAKLGVHISPFGLIPKKGLINLG